MAHLLLIGGIQGMQRYGSSWYPKWTYVQDIPYGRKKPRRLEVVLRERERAAANKYYCCLVNGKEKYSSANPEKVWKWVQLKLTLKT